MSTSPRKFFPTNAQGGGGGAHVVGSAKRFAKFGYKFEIKPVQFLNPDTTFVSFPKYP